MSIAVSRAPAPLPVETPYQSIADVIAGLATLQRILYVARDRRAIFVTAYVNITREIQLRIAQRIFRDNAWVERYLLAFANLYRKALAAFEAGEMAAVPKPWRIAFDAALSGTTLTVQDLVLGINAHINHDLPVALAQATIDPDREKRYADHTAVNQALTSATDLIQDRISQSYAPALSLLDHALGPLDEALTNFSFAKARERAWTNGLALANAGGESEREAIRAALEDAAAVLARLVLLTSIPNPVVREGVRHLEQVTPWWISVGIPDMSSPSPAPVAAEALTVNTLPELMATLETIIQRFDDQRSRLSIYPTIYMRFCQRVKDALRQGGVFEDGEWLVTLDLHFATQYLRALASFDANRLEAMPRCWAITLRATAGPDTITYQDLILAVNSRLNHDLAIALLRAGLDDENIDRRRRDLGKMHDIFVSEIGAVQELIARKYSEVLFMQNLVPRHLAAMVVDFNYTRARDGAWENALTLARAPSEERRVKILTEIDEKTTRLAQQILLQSVPGSAWVIRALRHLEDAFPGTWSGWVTQPS